MRVAVVCEFSTLLGGERSLLAAHAHFPPCAVQAVLLCPDGPLARAAARQGMTVRPWSCRHPSGAARDRQQLREELKAALCQIGPNVVHANSLSMGRLAGPVAAALGIPSIAHLRDIVRLSAAATADLASHTRLLAVSHAVKRHYTEGAPRLCAKRVHVLYNGVDLAEFRPRAPTGMLHRELSIPVSAKLVLSVGQIILRKGWDTLIEVARQLTRRFDLHFIHIGARHSEKAETVALSRRLELAQGEMGGRFHCLGERTDVAAILPEGSLLLHTARQEPLGRVLLEAAASGLPIVATDVGGTREIFPAESEAAVLTRAGDAAAMAAAVTAIMENSEHAARLAERARRRMETHFDLPGAAAALWDHYRGLAEA